MSGGSLNYFYSDLKSHIGDFGDRELDDLVKDLAELFHDREWYLSSDTCEGSWNEARDAFKKKWFTEAGRSGRIEKYLEDIKAEVLKSLGLTDNYCKNCSMWTSEHVKGSPYGVCSITKHCLMHRYESCENFSRKCDSK